jgi:hypothetical protein
MALIKRGQGLTMSEITDLLERFRRGAELVAVVSTGAAGAEWDFVPGPDKWSLRQIVCHLADSEMVGRDRFCRVAAEDNAVLHSYNEKAWAENLDYRKRKFSQALETFRRTRGENFELLKGLPEEAFARTGTHSERGPMTLKDLLQMYAEHAEGHARQIRDTREAYKASKAK